MKKTCFLASCLVACAVASASAQVVSPAFEVGSVPLGSSAAKTVTVTLPYATKISSIEVFAGGAQGLDFITTGGTCKTGVAYAAGASCTLQVKFTPQSSGARYGEYMLYSPSGQLVAGGYLAGSGAGPRATFLPLTASAPLLEYGLPIQSAAVDENNGFYIAEPEISSSAGSVDPGAVYPLSASFINPDHVEVDGGGNVYVDDEFSATPGKFMPQGGGNYFAQNILPVSTGQAVDAVGNFYSVCGTAVCEEVLQPNLGYVPTTLVGGFVAPGTVTVDFAGDLYVTDFTPAPVVYKETWSNGIYVQSKIGKSWVSPQSISVDEVGNVYVYDPPYLTKETLQLNGTYSSRNIYTDSAKTRFMTVSPQGNVYVAQSGYPGEYGLEDALIELQTTTTPTLTFSKTAQGAVSKDGVRLVIVTNSGTAPLHFSSVTFPVDFPERANEVGDCRATTVLAAGQSCSLSVTFAPVATLSGSSAVLTENVLITTNTLNATGSEQKIAVTGTELPAIP